MERTIKVSATAITALLSSLVGALYIPVLLMVTCNVIDYITGLIAAGYRNNEGISSYKSMKGIAKKICMWLLVIVGAVIDILIKYTTESIGMTFPFDYLVACIVAIWIVCNELISILENMIDIGVKIPKFLLPIVKLIKQQAEDKVNIEVGKEDAE